MRIAILFCLIIAPFLTGCFDDCGKDPKCYQARAAAEEQVIKAKAEAEVARINAEAEADAARATSRSGFAREYDALHERIGKRRSGSCGAKVDRMKKCLEAAGVLDECQRDGCKVNCSTEVRAVAQRCARKAGGTW